MRTEIHRDTACWRLNQYSDSLLKPFGFVRVDPQAVAVKRFSLVQEF
jgi:hypothetical protein